MNKLNIFATIFLSIFFIDKTATAETNSGTTKLYSFTDDIPKKDLNLLWKNYLKATGLNEKNEKKFSIDKTKLGGFQYDIDGDGKKDWFLSLNHYFYCGMHMGCLPIIFPSSLKGQHIKTCSRINIDYSISFNQEKTNGFYSFNVADKKLPFQYNGQKFCSEN